MKSALITCRGCWLHRSRAPRTSASNATNYDGGAWSPYVVGAGIGVLSWLTFYFADKTIGASSFYATLAGFLGKLIAPTPHRVAEVLQKQPASRGLGLRLRHLHDHWRLHCGVDGRRVPQRVAAPDVGRSLWREQPGSARDCRLHRRRPHGLWRADGRRLHERPRNQRHAPAQRRLVADRGSACSSAASGPRCSSTPSYDRSRQSREGIERVAIVRRAGRREASHRRSSSASRSAFCCRKAAWRNTTSSSASSCCRTSPS